MFYKYNKNKLIKIGSDLGEPKYVRDPKSGVMYSSGFYQYFRPYQFADEHFIRESYKLLPTNPTHHDVFSQPGTYFDTELPDFYNDPFWRKVLINLGEAVNNPEEFEKVVKRLDELASLNKELVDKMRRKSNEIRVKFDWITKRIDQLDNWVEYSELGPAEYEAKKYRELFEPAFSNFAIKRRIEENSARNNVENTASIDKDSGGRNRSSGSKYTGAVRGNTWSDWLGKNYVNVGVAGVATLAALAGIYALYRYLRNRKKKTIKQEETK